MKPTTSKKIFSILAATIPNPTTELNYSSTFELLIAVLLSARATDKSVNQATAKLFKQANTPEKMVALKTAGVKKCIKNLGLYNNKAANIIKTCQILIEKFASQVPTTRTELEQLPGVGRKTTNVILNIAFNKPTIPVDTHVFRVANRTGLAPGKNPAVVEAQLLKIVPPNRALTAGNLLLLHGRYTCRAHNPKCATCPINKLCNYKYKNLPKQKRKYKESSS